MVARNLYDGVQKLSKPAERKTISETRLVKFRVRMEHFAGKLGVSRIFDGIEMDGKKEAKRNRFVSHLHSLPQHIEDVTIDEIDDKYFPDFDTMAPGDVNCSTHVTDLLPLSSPRVRFFFSVLPSRARTLALRLIGTGKRN